MALLALASVLCIVGIGLIAMAAFGGEPPAPTGSHMPVAARSAQPEPASPIVAGTPPASERPSTVPASPAPETLLIGTSVPLSWDEGGFYKGILNGIELAVEDANEAGVVPGVRFETRLLDYGRATDPEQARKDMQAFADDDAVIAVVGPTDDWAAWAQIPVSNAAGLLQCSPSIYEPLLTVGFEAPLLRAADPDHNNFIRLQVPGDRQGEAVAYEARTRLGLRRAAVASTDAFWDNVTDTHFEDRWTSLSGKLVGTIQVSDGISRKELRKLRSSKADAVFFAGDTTTGAALRNAMDRAGLSDVVLLGTSRLFDGPGADAGTYINLTQGKATGRTVVAYPYHFDFSGREMFDTTYTQRFGVEPAAFSAAGYVCGQVIVEAVRAAYREGGVTRARVTEMAATGSMVDSAWGWVGFDQLGDIVPGAMSIYEVNPALEGEGDWELIRQVALDPRDARAR